MGDPSTQALWAYFDERSNVRTNVLLKLGLWIGSVSVVLASFATILLPDHGGPYVILVAVTATLWFGARLLLLRNSSVDALMRLAGPGIVLVIPPLLFLIAASHTNPGLALSAWVPAQIWLVLITFSIMRLRVWMPVTLSAIAGALYLATWLVLDDGGEAMALRPTSTAFRVGCLLAWGTLSSVASAGLRRTIDNAARALRARDLFGKYRIGHEIASGGMGTVCRATYCPEGGFARDVAIKRIHPRLAKDSAAIESFRAEAELGARLHHQNIVATLDFGCAGDTYFFAMEYVDGAPLRQLLQRSVVQVEPRLAAHIGREVCRGLSFAHAVATDAAGKTLRVVHRDLCPNNILVGRGGHVKIADFGIAQSLGDTDRFEASGSVVGKAHYLAPEQVRNEPFDARVDLFALGCVLWELLTGERTFQRESQAATLYAIAEGEFGDITKLRPDLDDRWQRFFERALACEPAARFADAAAMGSELARLVGEPVAPDEVQRWVVATLDGVVVDEPPGRADVTLTGLVTEEVAATSLVFANVDDAQTIVSGPPVFVSQAA